MDFHVIDGEDYYKSELKKMSGENPEADMYDKLAKDMDFHESKKLSSDDRQVVLVDVDETICFYPHRKKI